MEGSDGIGVIESCRDAQANTARSKRTGISRRLLTGGLIRSETGSVDESELTCVLQMKL